MALRSVWVGGVCNSMLAEKKQAFQVASVKKKKKLTVLQIPVYVSFWHMFIRVFVVDSCNKDS